MSPEIPIDMVYSFTRDIVAGLNHLHQNGIIQFALLEVELMIVVI